MPDRFALCTAASIESLSCPGTQGSSPPLYEGRGATTNLSCSGRHIGETVAPSFVTAHWEVYTSATTDNKSAGHVMLIDKSLLTRGQVVYADPNQAGYSTCVSPIRNGLWTSSISAKSPTTSTQTYEVKEIRAEVWRTRSPSITPCSSRETTTVPSSRVRPPGHV